MLWACFIRNMIIWLHSFAWNFVTYALRHFAAISFCFLANSVDVWVCAGVFAFSLITFFFLISFCLCLLLLLEFLFIHSKSIRKYHIVPRRIREKKKTKTTMDDSGSQWSRSCVYLCTQMQNWSGCVQLRSILRPFFCASCLLFHLSLVKFDHFVNNMCRCKRSCDEKNLVLFRFGHYAYVSECECECVCAKNEWFVHLEFLARSNRM